MSIVLLEHIKIEKKPELNASVKQGLLENDAESTNVIESANDGHYGI